MLPSTEVSSWMSLLSRKLPLGEARVKRTHLSLAHMCTRPSPSATLLRGVFKNYNTIEDFRSPQKKKELFDKVVTSVRWSWRL